MVYFIFDMDGLVKIGHSENPEARRLTLQSEYGCNLYLHGVIPGGYQREQELHRRFAAKHSHGEWFTGDEELLADINELIKAEQPIGLEFPARGRKGYVMVWFNPQEMEKLERMVAQRRQDSGQRWRRTDVLRDLINKAYGKLISSR